MRTSTAHTLTRQLLVTTCFGSTTSTSGSQIATLRIQLISKPWTLSHPTHKVSTRNYTAVMKKHMSAINQWYLLITYKIPWWRRYFMLIRISTITAVLRIIQGHLCLLNWYIYYLNQIVTTYNREWHTTYHLWMTLADMGARYSQCKYL